MENNSANYKLETTLGRGYNSKVKLALNEKDGKKYAIKLVKKSHPLFNSKLLKKEFDILSTIDHPNIVKMHEFYENFTYTKSNGKTSENFAAIVMELVEGGDLFGYIRENDGFSEQITRTYFQSIITTLEYCHTEKHVVHRDLKPENILLDKDFNLKISDFGFATFMLNDNGAPLTLSTPIGTEGYRAPELYNNEPYDGAAVDVFAAGVILFAMLTKVRPFEKASESDRFYKYLLNSPKTYWKFYQDRLQKSRGADFSFTDDFKDLITSMLAFKPEDRLTIAQIKAHPWYNGSTLSIQTLQKEFILVKERIEEQIRLKREEQARLQQLQGFKECKEFRSGQSGSGSIIDSEIKGIIDFSKQRQLREYVPKFKLQNQLLTTMDHKTLFKVISSLSKKHFNEFSASDDYYKIKGRVVKDEGNLALNILLTKVDEGITCVEFHKKNGDQIAFYEFVDEIKKEFAEIEA